MLFIDNIGFEVTNTQDKELSAYGNSYLSLKPAITGEVQVSTASVANIEKTIFNKVDSEDSVLSLDRNSHGELEESTVNGRISIYDGSNLEEDDSIINCDNTDHSCVNVSNSLLDLSGTSVNCSNINVCINAYGSKIRLNEVSVTTTSVQYNAINISDVSKASIYDSTISTDGTTSGINLSKFNP